MTDLSETSFLAALLMNRALFGVLAEDDTDCDVADVLIRRIAEALDQPIQVGIRRRYAEGCAHLRRKAAMWMRELGKEGYTSIVLLHDLDRDPETKALRSERDLLSLLRSIETPGGVDRLICIPIEEVEAWFWSDPLVVKEVGRGRGAALPEPHRLAQPKEALIRLSRNEGRRPLYSTNDNKHLAELLNLDLCASRCRAFRELREFVVNVIDAAQKTGAWQSTRGGKHGQRGRTGRRRKK